MRVLIFACCILCHSIIAQCTEHRNDISDGALKKILKTIEAMGGDSFLEWQTQTSYGRSFAVRDERRAWTRFWSSYSFFGKLRSEYGKRDGKHVEIYDSHNGRGWIIENASVSEMKSEQLISFKQAEWRSLPFLFRNAWKDPQVQIIHYVADDIRSLTPQEALEFIDSTNQSVTILYDTEEDLPIQAIYEERNPDGLVIPRKIHYSRWFKIQGIQTPLRVEFHSKDKMTGLIEYSEVRYNIPLENETFAPSPTPIRKNKK